MPVTYICGECGGRAEAPGACPQDHSALELSTDLLLGTDVGRYRLTRVIGQGGMGKVYAAVHAGAGSRVAIKVIAEQYAQNRELLDRFFAEARAVNLIKHEYIVNVIDLAQLPDGRPYIVMELVRGRTLRELVRVRSLPLGGLVQLAIDVLSALGAAHAIGIVHRDLKPDNILVTGSGRPKVLDFGIAKLSAAIPGIVRTQSGIVLGTPQYMAPEQAAGVELDARCDVYAVGVLLYEAVTGQRPFDGSDFEVMKAHIERVPPPPRTLRPDLPEALEAVILRALAKRPSERFPTAKAMAKALRRASSSVGTEQWRALASRESWLAPAPTMVDTTPDQPTAVVVRRREAAVSPPPPPRSSARRRVAFALAAAGGVVAAGVAIALSMGSSERPEIASTGATTAAGAAPRDPGRRRPHGAKHARPPDDGQPMLAERIDARAFDPVAYLAAARALARRIEPDVELVELVANDVSADGALAMSDAACVYTFRSSAYGKKPDHEDSRCGVRVTIGPRQAVAQRIGWLSCVEPTVRAPRCRLAAVRRQAAAGAGTARLTWSLERWTVAEQHRREITVRDDCP